MDRQLQERLIGAGVLVVLLVVVVPAILDGGFGDDSGDGVNGKSAAPATVKEPRRTHTIRLDQSTERPPVAQQVTEPAVEPVQKSVASSAAPGSTSPSTAAVVPHPAPVAESPVARKPPAAPRVQSAPVPTAGWIVQLGSFTSRENARRLTDEVSARGFSAFIMSLNQSGTKLYRVRVGPRETRDQATTLARRLAEVGYTGQVMRQLPDA